MHIYITLLKSKLLATLVLASLCSATYAQELWTGITLRVKPAKKLTAELEQQFRFNNGINALNTTFTEIGLGYDITKRLGVKAAYRNTYKTGELRVDNDKQRLSAEITYDMGSDETQFILSYRFRYQVARETGNSENPDRDDYIRNRINLDYNLTKRVQPYVATEIFYKLNQNNEFRGVWLTMGLKSMISKSLGLNTFYRIEKEMNVKWPQTTRIIGVMLSYRIKLYDKKDEPDDSSMDNY